MTPSEWREFLQSWSDEWLATNERFPARVRKQRWLGFAPASETQLLQLEKRLGYALPPSYRNFLLTTNGWLRTSMFIERVRPVSKLNWLESDMPEMLDVWGVEDAADPIANDPPAEYFAYDGRPMFDREHLRKSIIIADPVAGDSMIYLLNPLVVAADGEWEAWRFANWIPGAERFPSFELLMRAEHELFESEGRSQKYVGPYPGPYAPDQPRHAARAIGHGRPKPRRLTIPELIAQLESTNRAARLGAAKHLLREFRPHDAADEHSEIVAPLARILHSDLETEVRSAAAAALGSYGDVGAIAPLIDAIDDPVLTGIALSALFYLVIPRPDPRIGDAIVQLLETPRNHYETEQAIDILEQLKDERLAAIGLRLLDEPSVILPDVEGMDRPRAEAHQNMWMRYRGAFAFARFATHATDELVKRLIHPNPQVRAAATAALRQDPTKGPHLVPHVTPLLSDSDAEVRQQASDTLRFLEPMPKVEIPPERLAEVQAQALAQLERAARRDRGARWTRKK